MVTAGGARRDVRLVRPRPADARQRRHPAAAGPPARQLPRRDRADQRPAALAARLARASTTATRSAWATTSGSPTATPCAPRCSGPPTATPASPPPTRASSTCPSSVASSTTTTTSTSRPSWRAVLAAALGARACSSPQAPPRLRARRLPGRARRQRPAVLAFLRVMEARSTTGPRRSVLCVNNLVARPQAAPRAAPVRALGAPAHRPLRRQRLPDGSPTTAASPLTLGSRDFFWLPVARPERTAAAWPMMPPSGATLVADQAELVGRVDGAGQRWYRRQGPRPPAAPRSVGCRFDDPAGAGRHRDAPARRDDGGPDPVVVYQVPLTYRGAPLERRRARADRHDGAQRARPALGLRRAARPRLRRPSSLARSCARSSPTRRRPRWAATSRPGGDLHRARAGPVGTATVLTGEQSNTSIICRMVDLEGRPRSR